VLQETLASFRVSCCTSQRLHQARCGVHSCVQAAAADRVLGRNTPEYTRYSAIGPQRRRRFGAFAFDCYCLWHQQARHAPLGVIATRPLLPLIDFHHFLCSKVILLLLFSQRTPLHYSAIYRHVELCRFLQCNADIDAKAFG
jgi:hypothetical protein